MAAAVAVAVLFLGPLAWLVSDVASLGADALDALTHRTAFVPLVRTLTLATTVSLSAAVLGTGLAWLTTRTDLPLRRLWSALAPLPLVFPSFVGAAALLAAVAPGGLVDELFPSLGVDRLPEVEGFRGAWLVLTLFTYPYVYLPVAARFASLPPSLEESARLLGRRPLQVFRTVVLPQSSGAIWAGGLLVFLYTVSDFGAVAQLRYRTLSVQIFEAKLDPVDGPVLGLLLGLVALTVVAIERAVGRRRAHIEVARAKRPLQVPLGRWRWPAFGAVAFVSANALLGPLAVLGFWAWRGLTSSSQLGATDFSELGTPIAHTALVGIASAVLTVLLVLPVAYLTGRHRTRLGGLCNAIVVGGFALPGLIIALSLVFWVLEFPLVGELYQTLPLLLLAYAIHFGAQAMRAAEVAVSSVPRRLDEAAQVLGAGRWRRLRTVELPLMLPGLLAGAGLVLLSTMKELPATLMLQPTGLDTLAVHVWNAREAARWADTGLSALALVALSGLLSWFLVIRRVERFD